MERKIILASHGNFSEGILNSLHLIYGVESDIATISAYMEESFDLAETVQEVMETHQDKELIVITDLFGGSVNNEFLKYIHQPNFYLIAGLNLPLLIELVTQLPTADSLEDVIASAVTNAQSVIQFCNQSFKLDTEEEEF